MAVNVTSFKWVTMLNQEVCLVTGCGGGVVCGGGKRVCGKRTRRGEPVARAARAVRVVVERRRGSLFFFQTGRYVYKHSNSEAPAVCSSGVSSSAQKVCGGMRACVAVRECGRGARAALRRSRH